MIRALHLGLYCVASLLIGATLITVTGQSPISLINALIEPAAADVDPVVSGSWPPQVGSRYPDLSLTDQKGNLVQLSDFAGKVILVELAAVPCPGCQAFAGGNQYGSFDGVAVQSGLESIQHYVTRFSGVEIGENDHVVLVQLLLYGKAMSSPTQDEVRRWAEHFQMDPQHNEIVLKGEKSLLGKTTRDMIPGFQLIDHNFVLQCDSTGHHPGQDLFRDLLPQLGKLAQRVPSATNH